MMMKIREEGTFREGDQGNESNSKECEKINIRGREHDIGTEK